MRVVETLPGDGKNEKQVPFLTSKSRTTADVFIVDRLE
jgi:hypothetical protein